VIKTTLAVAALEKRMGVKAYNNRPSPHQGET
jgi:hypothetical protein